MIQDFDQTVAKLVEGNGIPAGDTFVPRLCDTLFTFAKETLRDLHLPEWRNQFHGGLNAGYILGLLGLSSEAVKFLDKGIRIRQANRDQYSESESSVLEFVVTALEEFGVDQQIVDKYRLELKLAQEKEIEKPEDLRRQIIHIEADLECATGDLDQTNSQGRRQQGLLYHRLGDHERAIASFNRSMEEDKRDWRKETSIKNLLSIVDSHLAMGNREAAVDIFMGLVRALGPTEIEMGSQLPELFTDNFTTFHPYFEKLGLEDSITSVAQYAAARLKTIKPKEHRDRSEICKLTEILTVYYVGKGEYQRASDIFDAGREHLEYKHHLSRRKQAEFALRAGDTEKAKQLIAQDDAEKDSMASDRDEKIFELANLYLQLGNITYALDRLDGYCQRYKQCLVSGSYGSVFDTRRSQIEIMKGAIGKDYLQKVRDHMKGRADLQIGGDIKFLDVSKVKRQEVADQED